MCVCRHACTCVCGKQMSLKKFLSFGGIFIYEGIWPYWGYAPVELGWWPCLCIGYFCMWSLCACLSLWRSYCECVNSCIRMALWEYVYVGALRKFLTLHMSIPVCACMPSLYLSLYGVHWQPVSVSVYVHWYRNVGMFLYRIHLRMAEAWEYWQRRSWAEIPKDVHTLSTWRSIGFVDLI